MKRSGAMSAAAVILAIGAGALVAVNTSSARSAANLAELGAFTVDPVHSMIVFRIKHNGVSYVYGTIHQPEGSYALDFETPSNSMLEVTAHVDNLDTGHEGRDKHLKSPDFFSAKQFPDISFKGTHFEKTGEHTMKVTGDLTLLGKTNPVDAEIEWVGEASGPRGSKSGFEARFTIQRSEWGMTKYVEEGGLGDEVTLFVAIEGGAPAQGG